MTKRTLTPEAPTSSSPARRTRLTQDASNNPDGAGQSSNTGEKAPRAPVVIETNMRSYFTPNVAKRLTGFANVALPDSNCFSISNWPDGLDWGMPQDGRDDMSAYLCRDNEPVLLWIVAELHKSIFRDNTGKPVRCATVRVRPLLQEDLDKCVYKLQAMSSPPLTLKEKGSVMAKKWVVGKNEPDSNITEFSECFDATYNYKKRDPIPCHEFHDNDIVLAEVYVHRYRNWELLKERGGKSIDPNEWLYWITDFELVSLNLLVKAPKKDLVRHVEDFDL